MDTLDIGKEKRLVPVLRFKGFDGEWLDFTLGEAVNKKISYGIVQAGEHVENGMPYIKSKDINTPLQLEELQRTSDVIAKKYVRSEVKPGDIIFSLRGNIGISQILPPSIEVANLTQGTARISVSDKFSNKFLNFSLHTVQVIKRILSVSKGSTFQEISLEELRKVSFKSPTLPEQKKIATFLSAIDKKIQQLTRKKALLEQYKKGLMQQLFSGELRFRPAQQNDGDEEDYPAWEEKRLEEIVLDYRLGGNYKNTEKLTQLPLIKMGNLGRGKIKLKKIEYIPESEIIDPKDCIEYGDLFFNTRNTLDLVGKVAIWRNELPIAYYNSNLMYLKFENNWFMNYRLNSYEGIKALRRFATGTTSVAAIYTKDLLKLKINIPSLREQEKIATVLTSVDEKIETITTQITKTQTFKKGLLQQMFV